MPDDLPQTLIEAVRFFTDLDVCHTYMRSIKWPSGKVVCPKCGGESVGEIASRRMWQCRNKECRKQFSAKVGTIFEDSPLGLDKWFVAVWYLANCKNGISSHELGRAIGVTQKTAWFMLARIRTAMQVGSIDKWDGPAEADTTFIGGAAANMHADKRARKITGRGPVDKTAVHGVLRRAQGGECSQVHAEVIGQETPERLLRAIRRKVRYSAKVYTDETANYGDLALTHIHRAVNHSVRYVEGEVHVNGMENFWALLKRGLNGTYVAVAPFHLFRYVVEQVFRFNSRLGTDAVRFHITMLNVVGKRLTWRVLTGKDDAGFMGLT